MVDWPDNAVILVYFLSFQNLWWSVVNLLPIRPLDGGNVTAEVFGIDRARRISIVAAIAGAIWAFFSDQGYAAFFALFLAFNNWQEIRAAQAGRRRRRLPRRRAGSRSAVEPADAARATSPSVPPIAPTARRCRGAQTRPAPRSRRGRPCGTATAPPPSGWSAAWARSADPFLRAAAALSIGDAGPSSSSRTPTSPCPRAAEPRRHRGAGPLRRRHRRRPTPGQPGRRQAAGTAPAPCRPTSTTPTASRRPPRWARSSTSQPPEPRPDRVRGRLQLGAGR